MGMLALVNGEPVILSLRKMLQVFLDFRVETIEKRTKYLLKKAESRDHLLLALDQLDEIISLIRSASDSTTAKNKLQELHGLTDIQSDAILQMQLRRLTALEADKIRLEHEDLVKKIIDLKDILNNKERVFEITKIELNEIKEKYNTPRRTK